ncbi:MAG: hypothetical protein NT049_10300 [Planctomycetota bacterium]|nr:hypothetical protein [Planctomycetota bacterium]
MITTLEKAPTLGGFVEEVAAHEDHATRHEVAAYNLKLEPNGLLAVRGKALDGMFHISPEGLKDLSRLAAIPAPYFGSCDDELRAISFNHRLRQNVAEDLALQIVVDGEVVARVQDCSLLPAPRLPILRSILNAIPDSVTKENVKVLKYAWNGRFDISIISPTLTCQPRPGDTVAFGINVSEDTDGAIQVQGAALRLACTNGAITRTCDGRFHRLRRPPNRFDRQNTFLRQIENFAREAWALWPSSADGLSKLDRVGLGLDQRDALIQRLRQAPFFLSLRVVNHILDRLPVEVAGRDTPPTMYDLFNAMTFLGTHNANISAIYRSRLRLGAGEFTRHESAVCRTCRQLLLKRQTTISRPEPSRGQETP